MTPLEEDLALLNQLVQYETISDNPLTILIDSLNLTLTFPLNYPFNPPLINGILPNWSYSETDYSNPQNNRLIQLILSTLPPPIPEVPKKEKEVISETKTSPPPLPLNPLINDVQVSLNDTLKSMLIIKKKQFNKCELPNIPSPPSIPKSIDIDTSLPNISNPELINECKKIAYNDSISIIKLLLESKSITLSQATKYTREFSKKCL